MDETKIEAKTKPEHPTRPCSQPPEGCGAKSGEPCVPMAPNEEENWAKGARYHMARGVPGGR